MLGGDCRYPVGGLMSEDDENLRDAANVIAFVTVLYALALVAMWVW